MMSIETGQWRGAKWSGAIAGEGQGVADCAVGGRGRAEWKCGQQSYGQLRWSLAAASASHGKSGAGVRSGKAATQNSLSRGGLAGDAASVEDDV